MKKSFIDKRIGSPIIIIIMKNSFIDKRMGSWKFLCELIEKEPI
jgi:hypothetical protein